MADQARQSDDPNNPYQKKWSGDDDNYDAKYGSDTPGHYESDNKTDKSADESDDLAKDEATAGQDSLAPQSEIPEALVQHENQAGRGYHPEGSRVKKPRDLRKIILSRRGATVGGAGILGVGIIVFIIVFLPILRLESYLANINQRVFGFASSAVSQRVEYLFDRYMITRVIQLDRCGNKVTSDCTADYTNKGIAGGLFNAWRDAKIEQKLIDKFNLKFETNKNPISGEVNKITIRNGETGKVITLSEGQIKAGKFSGGDREFGREVNKFLKQETRWYEVMQRRSVRKYLVRKHDTKFWCFFACKTRDTVALKKADAKTRFKYRFAERVVFPFSGKLGFIMDCITSGGDTAPGGRCSPEELRKKGIDRDALADEDIDKIVKDFKENPNARLGQYLTQKLLEKIMSKQAARATIATIPGAGQVYFAVVVIDMLDRMDGFIENNGLSKFAADLNSRQYLEYYTAMRSANDEMKGGALSLEEAGAIMDGFSGAEESLVYQNNNGSKKSSTALFGDTAYAAENDPYLCADGKPVPEGALVCSEKKVTRTFKVEDWRNNNIVDGLFAALNTYECATPKLPGGICPPGASPRSFIRPFLDGIDKVASTILGPVVSTVFSGIENIPYVGDALSYAKGKSGELMTAFLGKVFPLPVQLTSPGREKYDGLEAGGEVAASEFGKGGYTETGQPYGLGGKLLTSEQQASIWQNYSEQQDYEYRSDSLFAKLTNRNQPNSLVSRFIAAMPTSFSQLGQRFMAMMSRPFSNLSLGSPAFAATNTANINTFGIDRYGYTVDDATFTADPATYTEEYCQSAKTAWENSKTQNPITGFDEYSVTNPCLLEFVATEAASSVFTNEDCLGDTDCATTTSTPPGAPGTDQLIAPPNLGPQIGDTGYYRWPDSLNGEYVANGGTPANERCGSLALVKTIYTVASAWNKTYPNSKLAIGDLNASGHASHLTGVDVDIYSADGSVANISGDRQKSIALGRLFADTGLMSLIFYNDSGAQADFNNYVRTKGLPGNMQSWPGHGDHFHVRILDKYSLATSAGCPQI